MTIACSAPISAAPPPHTPLQRGGDSLGSQPLTCTNSSDHKLLEKNERSPLHQEDELAYAPEPLPACRMNQDLRPAVGKVIFRDPARMGYSFPRSVDHRATRLSVRDGQEPFASHLGASPENPLVDAWSPQITLSTARPGTSRLLAQTPFSQHMVEGKDMRGGRLLAAPHQGPRMPKPARPRDNPATT